MNDLEVQGVLLDFDKTLSDHWTLYFTSGTYYYHNSQRSVEPAVMSLIGQDFEELTLYKIYYNPKNNQYTITKSTDTLDFCVQHGFNLGGFTVNGCKLTFQYPDDGCVRHNRSFSDSFNQGYKNTDIVENCNTGCQSFTFEFTNAYNTEIAPCSCNNSIGTDTGTKFIVDNYLDENCIVAKVACYTSVGGTTGTEFLISNRLYDNCKIAVE